MMEPVPRSDRCLPTRSSAVSAVTCVIALALVLGACGGGGKHPATQSKVEPPKVLAVKTSVLKVGSVDVESAGPKNIEIDTATGKAVLGAAQAYIDNAVFAPLKSGQLGHGYGALFDPRVQRAATGSDGHALTDLDIGRATSLTTKATPVELSALAGKLGELLYVATNFDLIIRATTDSGPLVITHHIELTFAKTGATWLISAYRVQSVRKAAARVTTTTATSAPTGGTKP